MMLSVTSEHGNVTMQKDNDAERITGDAATFVDLPQLTNLRLENTGLTGILTTGPRVREVVTVRSQHESFKTGTGPADDFELTTVSMTDGRMTGEVPINLLTAPAIQSLSLRRNRFTGVPQDWGVTMMRALDLSENSIEVCTSVCCMSTSRPKMIWSCLTVIIVYST